MQHIHLPLPQSLYKVIVKRLTYIENKKFFNNHIMMETYKIKKGLDIRLEGVSALETVDVQAAGEFALVPDDFHGIVPKVKVKEGEQVLVGTPLFVDKATETVRFVAPVSGTVTLVERGERRKVLSIRVKPDSSQAYKSFEIPNVEAASADEMCRLLLESGIFAFLRQRPYDVVPTPGVMPKAIFVSAFSKMPLAADFSYVVKGQEEDFRLGIAALARIAKVHVGISPEQAAGSLANLPEAEVSIFDGPNPSGLVGVQINHISPVNKGEVVWTLGAEEVLFHNLLGGGNQTRMIGQSQVVVGAEIQYFLAFYCDGGLLCTFDQSFLFVESGFFDFSKCLAEMFFHFTVHKRFSI